MNWFIKRNSNGERQSAFCTEHHDGTIDVKSGHFETQLVPARFRDGLAFAGLLEHLKLKSWFTAEVYADLTNMITTRWLHDARSQGPSRN